eukprot:6737922-Alexandrium_andersonii.AAC.1
MSSEPGHLWTGALALVLELERRGLEPNQARCAAPVRREHLHRRPRLRSRSARVGLHLRPQGLVIP